MYDWFTWLDAQADPSVCSKCGKLVRRDELEAGHRIPLKDGGTNTIDNLVCLCKDCHKKYECTAT